MEEIQGFLSKISIYGVILLVVWVFRLKHQLKAELVDPDINALKKEIKQMREDFEKELAAVKEDGQKMSEKIDKKFDEVNAKLDKNSQAVSTMNGMLTAIFNGLRSNQYGQ